MVKGIHSVELDTPITTIWDFVSDMNNWAPLVPGYVDHQMVDERHSIWKVHGDIGVMERTVSLNIHIIEWKAPNLIVFQVSTRNGTCKGEGYFQAEAISESKTKMMGSLDLTIRGMIGRMINPVLKTFVPKVGKDFTEKMAAKITEREVLRATI